MKALVVNCGSSSLKYQLLDMETEAVMASGLVERIGEEVGALKHKKYPDTDNEAVHSASEPIADHKVALETVVGLITDADKGVIADASEIDAIGHRVVHGGEAFHKSVLIDDDVIKAIEDTIPLAPLHNPANLTGIKVAKTLFADVPQVAVFDTAFHQTMEPEAYMYAIPYELYKELHIRRYGFHGTSHKFVTKQAAKVMGKSVDEINLVSCHLGNGGSITAVKNGKCVENSMGMTPLAGVIMGTRSGDIDPAVFTFLGREKGMTIEEIDSLLNKESGLKGICGYNDLRDIHTKAEEGDERAKLALDMLVYRNKKFIGGYMAVLGRVDAIVFTAGIGENDPVVRARSLEGLEAFGIVVDLEKNDGRFGEPTKISAPESSVDVWVIPTNEELEIAQDTVAVLKG